MISVVLASASKIRSDILRRAGIRHICEAAAIDEQAIKERLRGDGADVETVAGALADAKAEVVAGRYPWAMVIGADQILECEGSWFDKLQTAIS